MPRSARSLLICLLCLALSLSAAHAKKKKEPCKVCTKTGIDMPISLTAGTVSTPKFHVVQDGYFIAIQAQWTMPANELQCDMGFAANPSHPTCASDPLLEADWRVYDGSRIVAQGTDKGWSNRFGGGQAYLRRYIGFFTGKRKHKYTVEIAFRKNASVLDVTKPHLIISTQGPGS
jgi:hypothetical protein